MCEELIKWFKFAVSTSVESLVLDELNAVSPEGLFFVQVGANDGITNDPIYSYVERYNWRGVVIECVETIYQELQETYSKFGDRVQCVQAFCDRSSRQTSLFQVRRSPGTRSPSQNGISSKYEEVVRAHFKTEQEFRRNIDEINIVSKTLDCILDNKEVENVDLLVVDTEGSDYDVLQGFDIERFKPKAIMLEHYHLKPEVKETLEAKMLAAGYRHVTTAMNSIYFTPTALRGALCEFLEVLETPWLEWRWADNHEDKTFPPEFYEVLGDGGDLAFKVALESDDSLEIVSQLRHREGDVSNSIRIAWEAWRASPNADIACHLASLHMIRGDLANAEAVLRVASQFQPGFWRIALCRSQLRLRQGNWSGAFDFARRAISLAPRLEEPVVHLANLQARISQR